MSAETIRKRLEAASPGDWRAMEPDPMFPGPWVGSSLDGSDFLEYVAECATDDKGLGKADADLIAHAPTDLALLLDVAEAAQEHQGIIYCYESWPPCGDCTGCRLHRAIAALEAAP